MKLDTFRITPGMVPEPLDTAVEHPEQTLVVLFGAPQYFDTPEVIARVCAAYPDCHIIGCSTSGEIFQTDIMDETIVGAVVQFEHTALHRCAARIQDSCASSDAGMQLGRELNRPGLKGVLVLSDGLHVNGSELVQGLNAALPDDVVVNGGLAGDADRFGRTWVLHDGRPTEGMVTAVGFYGDAIRLSYGSKGGWDMFGPERRVTRSDRNILYELDGKPALELYKEYLGDRASELPASGLFFPLALRTDNSDNEQLVRSIVGIDETNQSMTFAGNIPEQAMAQLMRANFDRLVTGASEAAELVDCPSSCSGPILALAISCVGRRLVLGERTEEEVEATFDVLPEGTQQIGFYSYGELSPNGTHRCDLHNQTMTLMTMHEA